MSTTRRVRAGRQAALLFIGGGLITIVNAPLPGGPPVHESVLFAAGAAAVVIGLVCWAVPWGRWPARANLILFPLALAVVAIGDVFGHASPYSYALYYVLIFVWLGLSQPRGTVLLLSPAAAVVYVLPVLVGQSRPDMVVSLTDALPVCLLVGETIAWVVDRQAKAQAESADRVSHLESLVGAGAALECMTDPGHLPDEVARVAAAVFDSERALVLVGRPQGTMTVVGRYGPQDHPTDVEAAPPDAFAQLDRRFVAGVCARAEASYQAGVLVIPLHASLRTIGAAAVLLANPPDEFVLGLAQVFGSQAGLALERHGAVGRLARADVRDPVTGLDTRGHAELLLNTVEPGDVVALLALDGRRHQEAERLLGPFLRRTMRAHDSAAAHDGHSVLVILHDAGSQADAAIERLTATWARSHPSVPLLIGWATHRTPDFPNDTLDRARQHVAPARIRRFSAPWDGTPWAV